MPRELKDMVVIITGASAGIGRALAEELSGRGARLALSARRLDRLEELNASLGAQHLVMRADVAQPDDCRKIVEEAINRFGRIDTLVCNAGYGIARPTAEMTIEEMRNIFATNVFGTTDCIHFAFPHLLKQSPRDGWRGQIMIVSSAMAKRAVPHFGAYAATKAAQLSFAEALRVELRPHDIAVTSVHPIGTRTEFFDQVAQQSGGKRVSPATTERIRQTAQTVARRMAAAIRRPRAELWTLRTARLAMAVPGLCPALADRFLAYYRGDSAPQTGRH
jgi:short-subunit dehydrogenase